MRGRLRTAAPFHLEATVRVLQRRPENRVDRWEHNRYQRLLGAPDGLVLIEVHNQGTIDEPDVRYALRQLGDSVAARPWLLRTLRRVLGLDVDPEPLRHLARAERKLRPAALALRGMRPPRFTGLFEAFANVVPFQQLSLDAGVAIVGRLVERFGRCLEHGGRRSYVFPTAEAIAGAHLAGLRQCGLSARKAETLRSMARAIASGELNEEEIARMSSAQAVRFLSELAGIGP